MSEDKCEPNIDAAFYNKIAYRNNEEYLEKLFEMNIAAKEITQKDILDYGCGAGDASFRFARFSPSYVTAIDIGERNIELANLKEKIINVQFIRADLNLYDLGLNIFDLIWSDTTIELLRKTVELIIDAFRKALRPEGVLYLSFTKHCFKNYLLYSILRFLNICVPYKLKFIFYYLILPRYYITKFFNKRFVIDHIQIKEKLNYLFIPSHKTDIRILYCCSTRKSRF